MGMRILESNPKSHRERRRIEQRIRTICDTLLIKVGTWEHTSMTVLQWETLFSKVVNTLDNLPIAKGNATSTGNLGSEIITANRIKLGRNNFRSLGGDGIHIDLNPDAAKLLENNCLINCTWIVFISYLLGLVNGRKLVDSLRLMILYYSRSRIQDIQRNRWFGNLGGLYCGSCQLDDDVWNCLFFISTC